MASGHDTTQHSTAGQRGFWPWLRGEARPYLGWLLVVLGAVAIFFCWYGVSGQTLTAKQLPYFASDGLIGIGLLVIAAALIVTGDRGGAQARLGEIERKVDDLYSLLVLDTGSDDAAPATDQTEGFVALPTGTSYHRPGCALVAGKPAVAVDAATIAARSLTPCRVCQPGEASQSS
jgi:hypothetical protein